MAEEKNAKSNLVSTLVAGIAAMTDPSAASTATSAATANANNNWLGTQQKIQYQKELDAQTTWAGCFTVIAQWDSISAKQGLLTGEGIGKGIMDGLAGAGLSTLDSVSQAVAFPQQTVDAINTWLLSVDVQKNFGPDYAKVKAIVDQLNTELSEGGSANAEQIGYQFGKLLSVVIQTIVAPQTDKFPTRRQQSEIQICRIQ